MGRPCTPIARAAFEGLLGVHITQGYGMTEVLGVYVADYTSAPYGSCGRQHPPEPELVAVMNDDGELVAPGVIGEIVVHRSCAMHEYWDAPQLTAAAFDGDWYRTGDVGYVDESGFWFIVDRKKDVIIRGGFNIYSAEIERVLAEHPGVAEVAVIAEPHERLGEVPVAFVVRIADDVSTTEELYAYARGRLGALKTPERLKIVGHDELPRNAIGKVLKRELRNRMQMNVGPER